MKLSTLAAAFATVAAIGAAAVSVTPADAQNAGQIDRAREGASCPKCNLFQADFSNLELKDKNFAGSRIYCALLGSRRRAAWIMALSRYLPGTCLRLTR